MYNENFIKETDNKTREWLDTNFFPKHKKCIPNLEWTQEQFAWNDADFTGSNTQHYYLELKTRHNNWEDYDALTMIEADKFNKLLEHKGAVALLVLFKDCIAYFPPSKLFDAFCGIAIKYNCPDEQHPTTTKDWKRIPKAVGYFDVNKAVKFSYDDYGGKPEFV